MADEKQIKSWRDVPLTAGMLFDAIGRWMIDRTSLADAIQQAAEATLR